MSIPTMESIQIPYCGTLEFEFHKEGWLPVYNNCFNAKNGKPIRYATEEEARVAGVAWAKKLILEGLASLDRLTPSAAPSYPPATPKHLRTRAVSDFD